jgi:hypothetical protein
MRPVISTSRHTLYDRAVVVEAWIRSLCEQADALWTDIDYMDKLLDDSSMGAPSLSSGKARASNECFCALFDLIVTIAGKGSSNGVDMLCILISSLFLSPWQPFHCFAAVSSYHPFWMF